MKQKIENTIIDMVSNLLYYDRKEDSSLPLEAIDDAVRDGIITVDEMVEIFKKQLSNSLTK